MKKIAILISLVILLPYALKAQSTMSDQKVFEYVVKQYEMGASQTEIASDLLKKGVDIKQLQRVRNKYGKEYKSLMSSQSKSKIMNEDRSRRTMARAVRSAAMSSTIYQILPNCLL